MPNDEVLALICWAFDGIALWEPGPWRIRYANTAFWQLMSDPTAEAAAEMSTGGLSPAVHGRMVELLERNGREGAASDVLTHRLVVAGSPSVDVRLCRLPRGDRTLIGMIIRTTSEGSPCSRDSSVASRQDPLTGLPDREFLMNRLAQLLRGERLADRQFAVLFMDVDDFKQVNDEFGHLIGDQVLREAARRIAECLRGDDQVVRYGGDEFVALIGGVTEACAVGPVIGRIQMALAKPIALPEGDVTLSLSAGVAMASEVAGSTPEELLAAADRAMYAAKRKPVEPHAREL